MKNCSIESRVTIAIDFGCDLLKALCSVLEDLTRLKSREKWQILTCCDYLLELDIEASYQSHSGHSIKSKFEQFKLFDKVKALIEEDEDEGI